MKEPEVWTMLHDRWSHPLKNGDGEQYITIEGRACYSLWASILCLVLLRRVALDSATTMMKRLRQHVPIEYRYGTYDENTAQKCAEFCRLLAELSSADTSHAEVV